MKKAAKLVLFGLVCTAFAALLIFISGERVSGLSGDIVFNDVARCACGFESFYFIRGNTLYKFCPGHKHVKRIGDFESFDDVQKIKVVSKKDGKTYYPYIFDKRTLELKIGGINDDTYYSFPREHNPWKILIPYYF